MTSEAGRKIRLKMDRPEGPKKGRMKPKKSKKNHNKPIFETQTPD